MSKFSAALWLSLGFVIGWLGRGMHIPTLLDAHPEVSANTLATPSVAPESVVAQNTVVPRMQLTQEDKGKLNGTRQPLAKTPTQQSLSAQLQNLLTSRQFKDAVALVYTAQKNQSPDAATLQAQLREHLEMLLHDGLAERFLELVQAYLEVFYDDVAALVLLANYNLAAGYYSEAISVLHLAREYAYDARAVGEIDAAFGRFLQAVENFYAKAQDWYNLALLYQQADSVALLSSQQQLRYADVLVKNSDIHAAKAVLNRLLASEVNREAGERLSALARDPATVAERVATQVANVDSRDLALVRKGNQFIATLRVGEDVELHLLLDTGASYTTLTNEAFARLPRSARYAHQRSHVFSTANGLVRGSVYRFDGVSLGGFLLREHDMAVLDDFYMDGVDGLLGMNTLGQFKFNIDQDAQTLQLTPRQ